METITKMPYISFKNFLKCIYIHIIHLKSDINTYTNTFVHHNRFSAILLGLFPKRAKFKLLFDTLKHQYN